MTKRMFKWHPPTDSELDELEKVYPQAVETKTIVVRKPIYSVVAMMLKCKIAVPGIRLIEPGAEEAPEKAQDAQTVPGFLKGGHETETGEAEKHLHPARRGVAV